MLDIALMVQLFVLLNPLSSFPFLIQAFHQKLNVKVIALKSVLTAFAIAILMALVGPALFSVFGITLDSFRVAGGAVLFMLAYRMVRPKEEDNKPHVGNIDSFITIIATPMLTGPGTISFITVKAYEMGRAELLTSILGSFVLVGVVFFLFSLAVEKVNPKLVNILSRILGLFLMAVSVELIAKGLKGLAGIVV